MTTGFASEIKKYIRAQDLDGLIKKLHKGVRISKGKFTSKTVGIVTDYEWNHLDQSHRLYIHDAYHDALRIATSKDIAVSIMAFRNLPIYIQVVDMRIDRGLFYQSYTFFGLLFCHQICRMIQESDEVVLDIEWRTVSHWLLGFLHKPFNRRMYNLISKQNGEDKPLRIQRHKLRQSGVRFKTDEPDFLNSNVLSDMIIFPNETTSQKFSILDIPAEKITKVKLGTVEIYAQRDDAAIKVWPALCPHEGAEMPESKICNGVITCPWHNRRFSPTLLTEKKGQLVMGNLEVSIVDSALTVKQRRDARTEANPSFLTPC